MFSRLFTYARDARKEALAGGVVLGFSTVIDLLQPWPVKWLVDYVFGNQTPPAWLTSLWPAIGEKDPSGGILAVCLSILLLAVLFRLGITIGHFFLVRAGARVVQQLRCHACEHLHRLSFSYHDRTKVGDSLYRVAYDSQAAQSLLNGALVPICTGVLLLVGAVVIMFRINAVLTIVTLAAVPMFLIIIRGFSRTIDRQSRVYHEHESSIVSALQESLSSIRAIQAFTLEPETNQRFRSKSESSLRANEKMTRTQLLYSACAGLAVSIGTAAVVWVAGHQAMKGQLTVGDILVFLAYLGMLYQPMSTLSQSASVIQSASAQLRRVFEIVDAVPDIRDRANAVTLKKIKGKVEFKKVSFEYQRGHPVLREIDLTVQPGSVVALVGRTGAGKTTIASLLSRFYDPSAGSVRLDDHDLRDLKLSWLRQQVSVVLQDPILFSGSVAENIAYGHPGATLQAIQEAARRAQADQFIKDLPNGYETLLGERGVNLSGGQRQRLSIARAFLKNAPLLILDEPTSALDTHTEEALLACLKELMKNRTTLIIAHRLSTVRAADVIVVLDQGKIIELGGHEELLAAHGAYAAMYRSQWGQGSDSAAALSPMVKVKSSTDF